MAFDLTSFKNNEINEAYIEYLLDDQAPRKRAHARRLWNYYRNPLLPATGPAAGALNENSRPYFLAQELGLPARITGVQRVGHGERLTDLRRKEVVIENDIAWRVTTMVDFLFGSEPSIHSLADEPATARAIEAVLAGLLDANGGIAFLQEMALLGSVYGFVDLVLRIPADWSAYSLPSLPDALTRGAARSRAASGRPVTTPPRGSTQDSHEARSNQQLARAVAAARTLRIETIEASRILPVLAEDDYTQLRCWVQTYTRSTRQIAPARKSWLARRSNSATEPSQVEVVEILSPGWWQRYENRQLVVEGANALGRLPVVHVQNLANPGTYAGLSDVEPLIPLQDELNTRLSDRAHRVTYQSFKMYLGKGIEDFLDRPVGPGQMWATQNLSASIEEFGRDDGSPSEDLHIEQVRQAMDKLSGVTPVAAGLIRGEVGHLTSAAALRVVLAGLLSRTARKRLTYGRALQQTASLVLDWLDRTGVLPTRPDQRRIDIHWPDPMPGDQGEALRNAKLKQDLGLPSQQILAELGYDLQTQRESDA